MRNFYYENPLRNVIAYCQRVCLIPMTIVIIAFKNIYIIIIK